MISESLTFTISIYILTSLLILKTLCVRCLYISFNLFLPTELEFSSTSPTTTIIPLQGDILLITWISYLINGHLLGFGLHLLVVLWWPQTCGNVSFTRHGGRGWSYDVAICLQIYVCRISSEDGALTRNRLKKASLIFPHNLRFLGTLRPTES